jgi:hypothetical protein
MQRLFEWMGDRAIRGSLKQAGTWLHMGVAVLLAAAVFWVASLLLSALVGADEVAFAPVEAVLLGVAVVAVARWRAEAPEH